MGEYNPQLKKFLLPHEETLLEQLIRYGLYIGAVFQIVCLLSIVVYHRKFFDSVVILKVKKFMFIFFIILNLQAEYGRITFFIFYQDDPSDMECSENSPQVTPRRPHRPRKQEKKKRR